MTSYLLIFYKLYAKQKQMFLAFIKFIRIYAKTTFGYLILARTDNYTLQKHI